MLQAYEQDVLNNRSKTVAQLLGSWQNPVFTTPEKVRSHQQLGMGKIACQQHQVNTTVHHFECNFILNDVVLFRTLNSSNFYQLSLFVV